MSDSTVRVSKQANKQLSHIAIDAEVNKKELLRLIADNLEYDKDKKKLQMETEI